MLLRKRNPRTYIGDVMSNLGHILVAIGTIAIIAVYAISKGMDANVAYVAIVAIAGLGGYEIQSAKKAT